MENLNKKRKPRTLYLVRGIGNYASECYVTTNPTRMVSQYSGGYTDWYGTLIPRTLVGAEPRSFMTQLCVAGLRRAGVKVPEPGKAVRLTVFLRPVATPRPRK